MTSHTHTHEYAFWHIHNHEHKDEDKGLAGWEPKINDYYTYKHDIGHYHLWSQTHDHGESIKVPHTHKDKQVHPDELFVHHHAVADHEPPNEHHPECKLPYYGGGLKGCIDRCKAKKNNVDD